MLEVYKNARCQLMPVKKYIPDVKRKNTQRCVVDAPAEHWIYHFLPQWLWPYAQLSRWDQPIGWQLLLWPCWWSFALATIVHNQKDTTLACVGLAWQLLLFLIGAVAMRGAGCTYNDLIDQNIDKAVKRTGSRPLPSGKVNRKQAVFFMVLQSLVGFLVLVQFNVLTVILGFASLVIVAFYPFMKRITDWPQFFLGLAFSWGALLGWTANRGSLDWPPILLYLGSVFWTIGYDTIYAHQDKDDDVLVGVRSTACLFGQRTKSALFFLYGLMLIFITSSFISAHIPLITLSSVIFAAIHLFYQIQALDINSPDACLHLFKSNKIVGLLIFLGLILGKIWIIL
ncbi:MAG: 4-hydroxybenzoate polyprenyltransferase [Candidatus Tokpelaia sp. JSC085]|nr:MAG: 4-hydroxybenzoate polyprenyltransferase [Candidatus Tokpelaia sp. JSC085]